jgi:Conserved hypothetical protein (DUF2461).
MLNSEILAFLAELKNNNHKLWFDANRSWYLEVKAQFEAFVGIL